MGADKYSAEPRSQVFAFLKIMHAQGSSSEKLPIRMRNPCNRQFIPIHVRLQFFDSSLRGFFAKNRVPLLEEPLRQLRDVFWMLNQVANPNSTHIDSMLGLTRTNSAAASGSARGCGRKGFSHMKTGQYVGSPLLAALG